MLTLRRIYVDIDKNVCLGKVKPNYVCVFSRWQFSSFFHVIFIDSFFGVKNWVGFPGWYTHMCVLYMQYYHKSVNYLIQQIAAKEITIIYSFVT